MIKRKNRLMLSRLVYLFIFGPCLVACALDVPYERRVQSPNREFALYIEPTDVCDIVCIEGNAIKGNVYKIKSSTRILEFKWTVDSTAIVMIDHLAKGSIAAIVQRNKDGWLKTYWEPLDKGPAIIEVSEMILDDVSIKVIYKLTLENESGKRIGYQKVVLEVAIDRENAIHESRAGLTFEEYQKMPTQLIRYAH